MFCQSEGKGSPNLHVGIHVQIKHRKSLKYSLFPLGPWHHLYTLYHIPYTW